MAVYVGSCQEKEGKECCEVQEASLRDAETERRKTGNSWRENPKDTQSGGGFVLEALRIA